MTILAQQPFGFISGLQDGSTKPVVCCSLSNSAMTVTYRGTDFPVTLAATNSDGPGAAGYVGDVTITGIPDAVLQEESYTVTQGGVTLTGKFRTPPLATSRYMLVPLGCDAAIVGGIEGTGDGAYAVLNQIVDAGVYAPFALAVRPDDNFGYIDNVQITGVSTGVPFTTGLQHDYAVSYLNAFGLYPDSGEADALWGRDSDRVRFMRENSYGPGMGDHDGGGNNMGYNVNSSTSPLFTAAKAVWDKFMRPLYAVQNAATRSLDTTAEHWAYTVGCVRLIQPDPISKGLGDQTTIFGLNQISDLLNAGNTADAFKVPLMRHSIRYIADAGAWANNTRGAQEPLDGLAEYKRLATDDSSAPASWMKNSRTNGLHGTLFTFHGDLHRVVNSFNHAAAYAGNLAENFASFSPGNNGNKFGLHASVVEGVDYQSKTRVLFAPANGDYAGSYPAICVLEVRGDLNPKELWVRYFNPITGALDKSYRFIHVYGGNDVMPETYAVPRQRAVGGDE